MDEETKTVYEKVNIVGRGSYGLVWRGKRKTDGKIVAIKEIAVDTLSTGGHNKTVLFETKILAQLKHPNIITYFGTYETETLVSIVMEFAAKGSLHQYLQEQQGNLLGEEDVLLLFTQLVLGLHYLHSRNILHRDLKTHNVLLINQENCFYQGLVVKISDFGLSKMLTSHSFASNVLGTPSYSAPEICNGLPYCDRSDIWALGCILYEMLTLRKAFDAPTLAGVVMKIIKGEVDPVTNRACNTALTQLLNSLLHQTPNQRPSTAAIQAHPFVAPHVFRVISSLGCGTQENYN